MGITDIQVAVSQDFFTAYARIPKKQQSKVMQFVNKFRMDPTASGINYEKINAAKDPNLRSVRIDDTYRGIVLKPRSGNIYLFLWVDHHDAAYEWARKRRCEINPQLGTLQIYQVAEEEAVELVEKGPGEEALFAAFRDRELLRVGVPESQLPLLRSVTWISDLENHSDHFPDDVYAALNWLVQGESLEDVLATLEEYGVQATDSVDTEDFAAALRHPVSLQQFQVDPSEKELGDMFLAPLEKWRVFLHPAQRKLVERDWNGPVRVLGGAGTGKTVVAMHRAKWLAEHLCHDASDRILFTTFTRNLAADIQSNLDKIVPSDVMKRIEVVNLDRWVVGYLNKAHYDFRIGYEKETKPFWENALTLAPEGFGFHDSFYREEWEQVVQPQEVTSLADYIKASRTGRGVQLSRKARKEIWPVFEEYQLLLSENRLREPADAMRDARLAIEREGKILPYKAILVDEAQDMGTQAYRLLRAMIPEGKNDLFIVGDGHQRIYGKKVVLGQCGVKVVGRSRKLRINYRTTEETRKWAMAVMNGVKVDDLDGGTDEGTGYLSLIKGVSPIVENFDSFDKEISAIAEHVNDIRKNDGVFHATCVVVRTQRLLKTYEEALQKKGFPVYSVRRSEADDRSRDGIRIATMHRVKGLEFDRLILCGINNGVVPLNTPALKSDDVTIRRNAEAQERALLFVAATRAKKSVMVTSWGEASGYVKSVGMNQEESSTRNNTAIRVKCPGV